MTSLADYIQSLSLLEWVVLFGTRENPALRERVPFQPWRGQQDFLEWLGNRTEAWCPKARQLGLSEIAGERLVKGAIGLPRSQYVVISKTEEDAIYFLAERVLQKLENLPSLPGIVWPTVAKKSSTKIELSNGSIIWSLPAANASGASRTLNGFVVDEAGGIDKQPNCKFSVMYKNLIPTIEKSGGWGMIIGTSEPGTFFNQQLYKQFEGKAERLYYFLSWRTDPNRSEEWKRKQMSKYDTESDFRNQYPENMNEFFATKEGRVFQSFDPSVGGNHVQEFAPNFDLKLYVGYDHGYRHWAAALYCLYDDLQDMLYVFDEQFWRATDIEVIASEVRANLSVIPRVPEGMLADIQIFNKDARKSVADHFREYGVPWSPAYKADEAGSRSLLSQRFSSGRIIIHPSCRNTITQLTNYTWSTTSKGEKPVDKDDEAPDILRYICSAINKSSPVADKKQTGRVEYSRSAATESDKKIAGARRWQAA